MRQGGRGQKQSSSARSESGFTLLEFIMVLFLLGGMLSLVIPRITIGDSLSSIGRKWVRTLKSVQEMAMTTQKTVRLYVDIDQGIYWPMLMDGNQEKIPLDPTWSQPVSLSETIRFADIQVGATRKDSGRTELFFYPNGRIDPATIYLTDGEHNLMGILVEPVTAMIRITDQRVDPPQPLRIPDRIRPLLQPATAGIRSAFPVGVPK